MKKLPTLSIREWDYIDWQKIAKALAEQSAQNLDSTSKAKLEQKAKQIFSDLCDFTMQKSSQVLLGFKDSKTLQVRQYVGIISTKSGFCVEILPKLADLDSKANTDEQQGSIKQAREVFLKMLKTLRDSPFKHLELSVQDIAPYPLLEAFALMFVREVKLLLQRGLRCDYISIESNHNVLKGRLLFNEHLRQNLIHKERFFTASDEFSANIAPNRLLKTTLLFLANQGFSPRTQSQILALLLYFDEIDEAQNIEADFSACPNSRHFKAYKNLLAWCKVFLKHLSFCPSGTKTRADSLLFDMNVLFESFVAWHLKKAAKSKGIKVYLQAKAHLMHNMQFNIRPDIVLEFINKHDKQVVIADTKYKRVDSINDIYSADLYQVLAYLNAFDCKNAMLIYPRIQSTNQHSLQKQHFAFKSFALPQDSSPKCSIYFFDLLAPESCARDLLNKLECFSQQG